MHRAVILLFLLLFPSVATAQQRGTISPGMSAEEVRTVFGSPLLTRQADGWTYLFYRNRCLPRCGSDDVVFLRNGEVVAAVLRAPERRFAGPAAAPALQQVAPAEQPGEIVGPGEAADVGEDAVVRGIRIDAPQNRRYREPAANLGVVRGRASAPAEPASPDSLRMERRMAPPAPALPADSVAERLRQRNQPPVPLRPDTSRGAGRLRR